MTSTDHILGANDLMLSHQGLKAAHLKAQDCRPPEVFTFNTMPVIKMEPNSASNMSDLEEKAAVSVAGPTSMMTMQDRSDDVLAKTKFSEEKDASCVSEEDIPASVPNMNVPSEGDIIRPEAANLSQKREKDWVADQSGEADEAIRWQVADKCSSRVQTSKVTGIPSEEDSLFISVMEVKTPQGATVNPKKRKMAEREASGTGLLRAGCRSPNDLSDSLKARAPFETEAQPKVAENAEEVAITKIISRTS